MRLTLLNIKITRNSPEFDESRVVRRVLGLGQIVSCKKLCSSDTKEKKCNPLANTYNEYLSASSSSMMAA